MSQKEKQCSKFLGAETCRIEWSNSLTQPGRRAGDEIDLTFTWAPRPWVALDASYAHFYARPYLQATGAASDADFFYLQTTVKL